MNKLLILILPLMLVLAACGGKAPKGASGSSGGGSVATATGDTGTITSLGNTKTYTEYTDVTAPTAGWDPMVCATDGGVTTTIKFTQTYTGAGFDDKANWDDAVISITVTATGTASHNNKVPSASIYVNDVSATWANAEGWTTVCSASPVTAGTVSFVNNGTTAVGTYTIYAKKANAWGVDGCTGAEQTFTGSFTATLAGSC